MFLYQSDLKNHLISHLTYLVNHLIDARANEVYENEVNY